MKRNRNIRASSATRSPRMPSMAAPCSRPPCTRNSHPDQTCPDIEVRRLPQKCVWDRACSLSVAIDRCRLNRGRSGAVSTCAAPIGLSTYLIDSILIDSYPLPFTATRAVRKRSPLISRDRRSLTLDQRESSRMDSIGIESIRIDSSACRPVGPTLARAPTPLLSTEHPCSRL